MLSYLYSSLTRLTSVPTSLRAQLLGREDLLRGLREGRAVPDLHPRLSNALAKLDWARCEEEDRRAEAAGVTLLAWDHPRYPEPLRHLPDPPPALYLRGPLRALEAPGVAVVGSRLSTVYGQNVSRMMGEDLAREGFTVISGLARGIDTAAHEGALAAGGFTAGVLGTGIDVPYPAENRGLMDRIEGAGGAVLSEFPPGTSPMPRNFPARNRVIAGLSWAVLVIEATERSGALITARFAIETGRECFAVPHNLTSRTGVGPNTLIQKGAKLIQRALDVRDELPQHLCCMLQPPEASPSGAHGGAAALSEDARALAAHLRPDEGVGVDALCQAAGLPAARVLSGLLELQMSGRCVELPGMRYALKRIPKET